MPKIETQKQMEMFKGMNYGVLKQIIGEGITSFGPLIYAYNNRIEPNREKIDAFNSRVIKEIANFLRSEGLEQEAKKMERILRKDNRAGELKLLDEKPLKNFNTFTEKSLPKEDK